MDGKYWLIIFVTQDFINSNDAYNGNILQFYEFFGVWLQNSHQPISMLLMLN